MGVKEDKPNTPKKPFIYYYTIMMVVLMALNLFLMPMYRSSQVTEVPYSTFLDMVDQGVVTSVERSDDEIVFLVKTGNKTVFGDDEIASIKPVRGLIIIWKIRCGPTRCSLPHRSLNSHLH